MDNNISGKKILITGASSGIGLETSKLLCENGGMVFGIGRNFGEITLPGFTAVKYDLTDTDSLPELIKKLSADRPFDILINNAGVGYYGTHEALTPESISEMVTVNLTVPMILSNLLLKNFKTNGGMIINMSSVTAHKVNTHGCAYGAAKAGLSSFGTSLFEEVRKTGVKVVNIHPDMTDTSLYRNADFTADKARDTHLSANDVAHAVIDIINAPEYLTVTDVTIKPQKHRIAKKTDK